MYCVKCRTKQLCSNVEKGRDKRGRLRLVGTCTVCGTDCYRYIKESGSIRSIRSKPRSRKALGCSKKRKSTCSPSAGCKWVVRKGCRNSKSRRRVKKSRSRSRKSSSVKLTSRFR